MKPGGQPPKSLNPQPSQRFDPEDAAAGLMEVLGKFAFWGGLVALILSMALLAVTYKMFTSGESLPGTPAQALSNIAILQKLLMAGSVAVVVGATFLFWGEEILTALLLIGSALVWTAPLYVPALFPSSATPGPGAGVGPAALGAIQMGGNIMGGLSILVLVADIAVRVRNRARQGARADQLKFGKGIKEERDVKNVFMGKCWQLPFCRKFVRERCPIYHSRRTCWRERVGCMCEEEVIRQAMENRTIPKDMVAAAKFIPYNNKVTSAQKAERCRQCVIYNEHQKHKYKMWLYVTLLGFVAVYVLLHAPLLGVLANLMNKVDSVLSGITFNRASTGGASGTPILFQELLLACLLIVALAYALKTLEYLIFKLKL